MISSLITQKIRKDNPKDFFFFTSDCESGSKTTKKKLQKLSQSIFLGCSTFKID